MSPTLACCVFAVVMLYAALLGYVIGQDVEAHRQAKATTCGLHTDQQEDSGRWP